MDKRILITGPDGGFQAYLAQPAATTAAALANARTAAFLHAHLD